MKILIVEDEARVGRQLEKMVRSIVGDVIQSLEVIDELTNAHTYLDQNEIDLLFLDLNLNGEDGFELLKQKRVKWAIITSAYRDRAIEAFEYNVLDFVPKPFLHSRLLEAIKRYQSQGNDVEKVSHLSIRKSVSNQLIDIRKIDFLKAFGHQTEIHLISKQVEYHHKMLNWIIEQLPNFFIRVHKSYAVNYKRIDQLRTDGNRYYLILKNGAQIPVGRSYYKELKKKLI